MAVVEGIDVSHYQSVNWSQVPNYNFVAAKATQGTSYVDPTFLSNWAAMRNRGFAHRVAYHFLMPGDPVAQAAHFQQVVGPLQRGETVALDWEQSGVSADAAYAFMCALKLPYDHCPLIYVGEFFPGSHDPRLARWPLWLPGYSSVMHSHRDVTVWQFSSSGDVPGISGHVDVNDVINPLALDLCCGLLAPLAPPPPPVAPPTTPVPPDYSALRRALAASYSASWKQLGDHDMSPTITPRGLDVGLLQHSLNLIANQGLVVNCIYDEPTIQAVVNFQNFINSGAEKHITYPPDFPGAVLDQTRFCIVSMLDLIAAGKA